MTAAFSSGDVDVAILCGGLGTRLRSVLCDRPKVLAEVAGRPFLAWMLDGLAGEGFRRVVLCTGYRAAQVEQAFGSSYRGVDLEYSREPAPLGTAGALRHARPRLGAARVLVLNGDSSCAADLGDFARKHRALQGGASLLLANVSDSGRFGSVACDESGRITGFVEKSAAAGPGWVNAGVYLIERRLVEVIPAGVPVSLERDLFPAWVRRGEMRAVKAGGEFVDIGTPESLADASRMFRIARAAPPAMPLSVPT